MGQLDADLPCAPTITFFPAGGEEANIPRSWGLAKQRAAGNTRNDKLYTVVLTSANNLPGTLVQGVPLLQVGSPTGGGRPHGVRTGVTGTNIACGVEELGPSVMATAPHKSAHGLQSLHVVVL